MLCKRKGSEYWYTDFEIDGKRVRRSTRERTREKAEAKARQIKELLQRGPNGINGESLWEDAVVKWAKIARHQYANWGQVQSKLKALDRTLGGLRLCDINEAAVADHVELRMEQGRTPATINADLSLLSKILRTARESWRAIDRDIVMPWQREDNTRSRWITREEAERLMRYAPEPLRGMIALTLHTGLRKSNVKLLKWSSVSLERRLLRVDSSEAKCRKTLGIPLNDAAVELLTEMPRRGEYVFGHVTNYYIRKELAAACKAAGIGDFTFHDLRHTWATWLLHRNVPLRAIQEMGGWASLAMVERYTANSKAHLTEYSNRLCDNF